ncbi:MAG TPA: hypothetical protein VLU25_05460 [Acidobacteriota bacterium]|nr:hypothetical protein [Acidobacteriota bacterium]
MKKTFALSLLGLLGLAAAFLGAGCGEAQGADFEVTYYYLPG